MIIVPFRPEHIDMIEIQPAQVPDAMCHNFNKMSMEQLRAAGPAITGIIDDKVIFCLGRFEVWNGRHIVWSLLSKHAAKHMVSVVRAIKRALNMQTGMGRLEIIVRAAFPEGCKLAEMMGFKMHHYEEKFLPDGTDAKIYVRYV